MQYKLRNLAARLAQSKGAKVASATVLAVASGVASAALPAEATTAMTTLQADISTMLGLVWGAAVIVTGGFVALKLFKKGANRAV